MNDRRFVSGLASSFTVDSLDEAASIAAAQARPIRAWRRAGMYRAELYFYRSLVIHAEVHERVGTAAAQEVLELSASPVFVELGRWPSRQTLLIEWTALRRGDPEAATTRSIERGSAVRVLPRGPWHSHHR